jgi:hypothetical protein
MEPIDLKNTPDFNKAVHYNYTELIREQAQETPNPPAYLLFYTRKWVIETNMSK